MLNKIKVFKGYYYPKYTYKYRPLNIWDNIKTLVKDHKEMIVRAKYGVSPRDCWDLGAYFCNTFRNALKYFKEYNNGYPYKLTAEEWDNILDRMIFLLDRISESDLDSEELDEKFERYCNSNYEDEKLKQEWIDSMLNFTNSQDSYRKEFFNLLEKYYNDLWW